jgi:hypothetical protein
VCPSQRTGGWNYVKVVVGSNLVLGFFFFFFLSEVAVADNRGIVLETLRPSYT